MIRTRAFISGLTVLMWGGVAVGATLRVPSEYAKIYEALDAAAANDTVLVAPGSYDDMSVRSPFGTIAALGYIVRPVVLRSEAGPTVTILDMSAGQGLSAAVLGIFVQYGNTGQAVIQGLRFVGAPLPPTSNIAIGARFSSNLRVESCEFEVEDSIPNTYYLRGGIDLVSCGDVDLRSCSFTNCRSGVVQTGDNSSVLIEGCTFSRCQNEALSADSHSTNVLRDSFFDSNVAAVNSGAVSGFRGTIERCVFLNNRGDGYGGAVGCGGSQVRDCLFWGNASEPGGGALAIGVGGGTVERCTFVGNHVDPGNYGGAAVYAIHHLALLRNSVIAASWGAPAVSRGANATIDSDCNIFWENADGDWSGFTPGPLDRVVDPQFCDVVVGDFTVRSTSPCLPEDSLGCGQIGAFGEGCGVISIEPDTWTRLKARFRGNGIEKGR